MSALTRGSIDVRKAGLRIFLTLLGVNALLGIAVVLGGDMGEGGWRVLGTSLLLTSGVVLGLACATGQGSREVGSLWMIGVGAAAVSTGLWILGIWTEVDGDGLWQSAATLLVVAAAIACAGMLSLATLPDGSRWMLLAAYGVAALLALFATIGIWAAARTAGSGRSSVSCRLPSPRWPSRYPSCTVAAFDRLEPTTPGAHRWAIAPTAAHP